MEFDYIERGECLTLMKELPDCSIDCIITSPPYNKTGLWGGKRKLGNQLWKNFNIDYDVYSDNMDESEYRAWQIDFINECGRILKPNGSLFYNHKIRRFKNEALFPTWVFETNMKIYQMIIWEMPSSVNLRNDQLFPNTELIFWMSKEKPKVFKNQAKLKYEVWRIPPAKDKEHPATFPLELAENCIMLTTSENDIVLDPFLGSGTTAIAAVETNRHYIGFEISEEYFDIACKRLDDVESKKEGD